MPISSDLFTKALALLAFVVAFYALAARERKTPYITNFLYSTAFWIFLASFLQLVAQFIEPIHSETGTVLQYAARIFLVVGAFKITYGIWRIHNRHVNFRDDIKVKNLAVIRRVKRRLRKKEVPLYEYDAPTNLLPALNTAITECRDSEPGGQFDSALEQLGNLSGDDLSKSIVYHDAPLLDSDNFVVSLARKLLSMGWAVQYTTCIRHPIELVMKLRSSLNELKTSDPRELFKQVVVIDAYTPHFGFTDSIHVEKTASLKQLGILDCVTSSPSYAGIHTATAQAFNKLKDYHSSQRQSRKPTFIIYEGPFALVDLESIEQYRIFIRHVLPSERLWGGMLTCVIEPVIDEDALKVLTTYADILLGKKKDDGTVESLTPGDSTAHLALPAVSGVQEAVHEVK